MISKNLLVIIILLVFVFIRSTRQECYEKLYKANSTCIRYSGRYLRTCVEYLKKKDYELHCYMVTGGIQSQSPNDVYNIEIYASTLNMSSEFFSNFPRVEAIKIENCNVTDMTSDVFANLTNLKSLNFTGNEIDVLYKGPFSAAAKITSLYLSENNISVIEDDFLEGFLNLDTLVLDTNNILNVSPLLDNCGNLDFLNLRSNRIEEVIFTRGCLKLITLMLSNNTIKSFIVNIEETSALNFLYLSNNNMDYIDGDSFKYFADLKILDLANNPLFTINELPVNLFQNKPDLRQLILSRTGIRDIVTGTFSKLFNLNLLDLSHNELTILPKGLFHDLEEIRYIDLRSNHLTLLDYDAYSKAHSKLDLNDNFWDCDTLADISKSLKAKAVGLEPGPVHNASNILGIRCFQDEGETKQRPDNLAEENLVVLKDIQESLRQIVAQQENILNVSKNFFEQNVKNDMKQTGINTPRVAEFTEDRREANNSSGICKSMVVGVYFIVFILIAGLFLLLLLLFKKYQTVRKPQEELRTLNSFDM